MLPEASFSSIHTGIVIPVYNRIEFVKQCFESLSKADLRGVIIVIVDDNSNEETKRLIREFDCPNVIHKIFKTANRNMHDSFVQGFDHICDICKDVRFLVTLDSDTVHKQNWIQEMVRIFDLYKMQNIDKQDPIVTGFNCVKSHPILESFKEYHIKESCGGVNMLITREYYQKEARNILATKGNMWDWEIIYSLRRNNMKILCTNPSVVQHIGSYGLHSGKEFDQAEDF